MRDCKIVSAKFEINNSHTLEIAKTHGAYESLSKIKEYSPLQIIDIIKDSNLRGKGGGGASAGDKWALMPQDSQKPSFLAVNCDESEPGTFKDREIISKDPHLLIEGIILTCYAIKAKSAYIYIRGEYKQFQDILQGAIDEAYGAGLLDNCDITIHRGAGAYICGEKSALLESMEGKRGHPKLKPK
ncbi:MAG: NADH-quinone oxidoreductase subunit F, partial [Campylobacterota bacterium]|nr:NADH-quinone oxidoreductase subunit F [Campylobacterota bacterium]